ncbi:MAG: hypothetical protein U9Q33_06520 [Campylobacterota bacterium]|nr:hypothetical protein [Campylobacterota bacterium]
MTKYIHYAHYLSIEVRDKDIELINFAENDKVYHLDLFKFNHLMREGSNRWRSIPCLDGSTLKLAYNKYNGHIYSADGSVNAYISTYEYDLLLIYLDKKEKEHLKDMPAEDYELYYGGWIDE